MYNFYFSTYSNIFLVFPFLPHEKHPSPSFKHQGCFWLLRSRSSNSKCYIIYEKRSWEIDSSNNILFLSNKRSSCFMRLSVAYFLIFPVSICCACTSLQWKTVHSKLLRAKSPKGKKEVTWWGSDFFPLYSIDDDNKKLGKVGEPSGLRTTGESFLATRVILHIRIISCVHYFQLLSFIKSKSLHLQTWHNNTSPPTD